MSKENNIGKVRSKLGLSQRALAELVGTSQQQIQRIESGVQQVRLDLAARIADALKSNLPAIFPELPKQQSKSKRKQRRSKVESGAEFVDQEYLKAGIDTDPRHWTLRIGFSGGEVRLYSVSAAEKERIMSILGDAPFDFFVFDSESKRVALNRTAITFCNFCFDIGVIDNKHEVDEYNVVVHFLGQVAPVVFEVEPDEVESERDDEGFNSQLQNLFLFIDGTSCDEDEVLWFDDEDGERVFLRRNQIVSLEVPLLCCEPRLWRIHLDNIDDDDVEAEVEESSLGREN